MTWPGGPQLARFVVGDKHHWEPGNELQGRYWSTSYPMDALVQMMRLVKYVRNKLPMRIEQSLLTIYSPEDQVVDPDWITRAFEETDSPRKKLIPISGAGDPGNHVLAGDIMAPKNNEPVADHVIQFVTGGEQQSR